MTTTKRTCSLLMLFLNLFLGCLGVFNGFIDGEDCACSLIKCKIKRKWQIYLNCSNERIFPNKHWFPDELFIGVACSAKFWIWVWIANINTSPFTALMMLLPQLYQNINRVQTSIISQLSRNDFECLCKSSNNNLLSSFNGIWFVSQDLG